MKAVPNQDTDNSSNRCSSRPAISVMLEKYQFVGRKVRGNQVSQTELIRVNQKEATVDLIPRTLGVKEFKLNCREGGIGA